MASRNGQGRMPVWVGRLAGEFATAVKQTLLPELQEHTKLLSEHSAQLGRHEEALQAIISVLREHSAILRDHSERLGRLETRTESLEHSVNQRFESLEHSVNQRFESLERSMDQGFRLLSDRLGDLAGEIRSNLELRDRVAKIEGRLGLTPNS